MEPWQKERDTRRSSRRRPSGCWPSRAARIRRRPRRSNRSPGIRGRAGDAAPLAQQDGRHGRGGDQAVGRRRDGGVEEFAGRGRAIEAGERDIDDGVGFFRGAARPDTALMVACIDEFKDRFRVGPICRVLAACWTAGSSRRAAAACSDPGPSVAWPPGTRRWPATSSRSMPISSWPCAGTARRAPSCWRGAGIRPRSAATR